WTGGKGSGDERVGAERVDQRGVRSTISRDGDGRGEQPGGQRHGDVYGSGERSQWDLRWRVEHGDDEYQRCSDVGGVHGERDRRRPVQRSSQCNGSDRGKLLTDELIGAASNGRGDERLGAERGSQHVVWSTISRDGEGRGEQPGERSGRDVYGPRERSQWDLRGRSEHGDDE